jgi:hypothetical protein
MGHVLANKSHSTSNVIQDLMVMISHADLDDRSVHAALASLKAADDANERRNRVVHDMWMSDGSPSDGDPNVYSIQRSRTTVRKPDAQPSPPRQPETRDLAYVDDALVRLTRASIRCSRCTGHCGICCPSTRVRVAHTWPVMPCTCSGSETSPNGRSQWRTSSP